MLGKSTHLARSKAPKTQQICDYRHTRKTSELFLVFNTGVDFSLRYNLANPGSFAKVSVPVHIYNSLLKLRIGLTQYMSTLYQCVNISSLYVSGIGAVVKVVDSHPYGWGSIPGQSYSFLIVSLSKSLSLCFVCSDQLVKYRMPQGFPLASSLLLDHHVKNTPTHAPPVCKQ